MPPSDNGSSRWFRGILIVLSREQPIIRAALSEASLSFSERLMSTLLDVGGTAPPAESNEQCCPRHADWPTLAQHLLDEYPDATITDIVREVRRARNAVEDHGLDDEEAVGIGEAIVRNQLNLLTGRASDAARLDPERHDRAGSTGAT
jgi:hypothetical protein